MLMFMHLVAPVRLLHVYVQHHWRSCRIPFLFDLGLLDSEAGVQYLTVEYDRNGSGLWDFKFPSKSVYDE
jgi:hypothetical protein